MSKDHQLERQQLVAEADRLRAHLSKLRLISILILLLLVVAGIVVGVVSAKLK